MAYRPTEGEIMHSAGTTAILAQLTRRQREAVLLLADGYTHEEAGEELGVTRTAVNRRITRAGERIQKSDMGILLAALGSEAGFVPVAYAKCNLLEAKYAME